MYSRLSSKILFQNRSKSMCDLLHNDHRTVYETIKSGRFLKLWQFKGTESHNTFRMVQSKVSVLVPLHVYALKQTRMQHISFGAAREDNVEPWLV